MFDQFMKKDKILSVNIVAKKWQLGKDSKIILGNLIIQSIVKYVKNKFRIQSNSKDMSYLCTKILKVRVANVVADHDNLLTQLRPI